jgi:hypothetical protein
MAVYGSETLKQASQHIQSGDFKTARTMLANYLRENPRSDQAWYLLGLCMESEERQIECLERAVNLNPSNTQAQNRLAQLKHPRRATGVPFIFDSEDETPFSQNEGEHILARQTGKKPDYQAWEPLDSEAPSQKPGTTRTKNDPRSPAGSALTSRKPDQKQTIPSWLIWMAIGLSVLTILVCAVSAMVLFRNRAEASRLALEATKNYFPTLPPTWTPTPQPPPTATPSPTATRIPTPTPTLAAPPPTALAQMDRIQKQVSNLRGLKVEAEVPRFLISTQKAKEMLTTSLLSDEGRSRLHDLARTLSAIGFIKPTYDLSNYVVNASVDAIGGFYEPWSKNIFVLGTQFTGLERFVYVHEFDHALVDQHFLIADMGVYPQCGRDSEQCSAVRALVEGDATLLTNQWLRQYAGPTDLRDLANYHPPAQALPEDFTPPAITQDLLFPYIQGEAFVEHLYQKGKWAAVNQAYAALPETSEQILHPEKYDSHEPAIPVEATPLEPQLGSDWQQIASDSFGEWNTYLLLAYGAELEAQLTPDVAQEAAAGWGGDHYQVYLQSKTNQTALALHWVWESRQDADEFMLAMQEHLDARFRGNKFDHAQGECWQANDQTTCLYQAGSAALWLLAPDTATIDQMQNGFSSFQ